MKSSKNFFSGFKKGQKEFGSTISSIVNTILLSLVYFIGVGLTSVFAKISNKDFLSLKKEKTADTYWEDLNLTKKTLEEYYHQF